MGMRIHNLGAALFLTASLLETTPLEASQIHLRTRDLDTSREPSGFLSAVRRANPDRRHILIEFRDPVNQALLADLAARDIVVNKSVGGNAIAVSVPENVRLEDLGVVWTGQLLPSDKLSPELDRSLDRSLVPLNAWIVQFHNDVDAGLVTRVLTENGLTVIPNRDLVPGDFLVTGERASLTAIADYDEVAYIFPASPEMLAGEHMNPCEGALSTGGAVAQYVTMGSGWSSNTPGGLLLNYAFTTLTTKVPASQVESEIQRAMKQWSAVANVQFQQVTNSGEAATVAIEFGTTVNGDPNPFTSLSALAHTYYPAPPNPEPIAGDMHFNPAETWHVGSTTDVYTVALHELGHSLGLGHTDNPSDVMYPYYHFGTPLSTNDIAGVQSLYGAVNALITTGTHTTPAKTLSVSVASPANGSSTASPSDTFSGSVVNPSGTPSIQWQTSSGQSGRGIVASSGAWTASIPLASGANMITITASDSSSHSVARVVSVNRSGSAGSMIPGVVSSGGSVPTIVVTSPKNGSSTTAASLTISGTASDSEGLQSVTWRTNSQASGTTTGTTSWTASGIPLYAGQNTVIVQATNINGVARFVTLTITKQ
jgi:hypothetical protein